MKFPKPTEDPFGDSISVVQDEPLDVQLKAMRPAKQQRMTVSLPAHLVAWVREVAARNDVPMSAVVELALRKAVWLNGEKLP